MNIVTIVIWIIIDCCIAFAFDLKIALNPIKNYKNWISLNWFGVVIITLLINIIFLPFVVVYWLFKLIYFLFTVGRKEK